MAHDNLITVELPSNGKLYGDTIPEKVTLRSMKVADEKTIYGSNGNDALSKVLRRCIVEPENINIDDLISDDEHYLLMQLRIHTFGSNYKIESRCTECGHKHEHDIILDDLIVNKLPDDFTEPIVLTLPKSGDKLELRLLRNKDREVINSRAKKLSKTTGVTEDEARYVLRYAKMINSINDEELDLTGNMNYVNEMSSVDSAYIDDYLSDIKLGYDLNMVATCNNCGEDYEYILPMTREFFKPKRRDK